MATTGFAKSNVKGYRTAAIAMVTAAASLIIVIAVIATMLLNQPATRVDQVPVGVTVNREDDYGLRHAPIAPNPGRLDDYGLRHPGGR